ncbi:MAG: LysR family transcriptional regulator [Leifsonia xyli]|nr:MAG: LysR family transcriptional regulator [Leifsonia xyli]
MPFDGRLLAGVGVLAAVVEAGSFVKAADRLGLTPSGVSRAVARLENRVGVRLLDRTTRSLRLTTEGAQFYEQVIPHLEGIEDAAGVASGAATRVRGKLRVNVDPFFSGLVLAPNLPAFCRAHPELEVEIHTRESIGDLVSDGMDLAVRFGPQPASSMTARLLLETRVLTVAAPGYILRHSRPKRPQDLLDHACIQYRDPQTGRPFEWEFHRGGTVVPVATTGQLLLTDVNTMLATCLASGGVAQMLELGIEMHLQRGRLVELFPDWPGETFPLYAIHPSKRLLAAKVKAFLEFCLTLSRAVKKDR